MAITIAHLGPSGTYTEAAAIKASRWLQQTTGSETLLCSYSSIAKTLRAVVAEEAELAVVPVENSIEGSVTTTLDLLWQYDSLQIQQALVLPISHALLSRAETLKTIQAVYSHPQALSQCHGWLETFLPDVQLIASNSTTEALQHLEQDPTTAAIAPQRAAQIYGLPVVAHPINDHPDNCTRFWMLSLSPSTGGNYTSLGFSCPSNVPGALVKPLQIFAGRDINLSRIESRPTKRSLGEYLFFIDVEADATIPSMQSALAELKSCTETLKVFGSYAILQI